MADQAPDHLVTIDENGNCIRIFRIMSDGRKVLFTEYPLPDSDNQGWTEKVTALAHAMGEDLLMDSPITRHRYAL